MIVLLYAAFNVISAKHKGSSAFIHINCPRLILQELINVLQYDFDVIKLMVIIYTSHSSQKGLVPFMIKSVVGFLC